MKIQPHSQLQLHDEKIKASEEQLNQIFNATNDILFMLAVEPEEKFRFISVNKSFYKATGIPKEKIIGCYVNEIIPAGSFELVVSKYKEAINSASTVQWEETSVYPSGIKTGIISVTPVYNHENVCTHLVGSVHDITDRKKIEQQLRESEKKLRHVLSSAAESFYVIDKDYSITLINKAAEEQLSLAWGKPVKVGQNILDLLPREDVPRIKENFGKAFRGHKTSYELRSPLTELSEWVLVSYLPVYDDCGTISGVYVETKEITERKRSEENLKKSNERFEMIAASTHDAIWEWNLETEELWANARHQQLYGLSPDEPIPSDAVWRQKIHPDERDGIIANLEETLASDKTVWMAEYRFQTTTGEYRNIYDRSYIIRNNSGQPIRIMGSMMDITERKKAEEALKRSEERYKALVENAVEALVVLDVKKGEFVSVSESATTLFKMSKEELLKTGPVELSTEYQPDGRRSIESAMEKINAAIAGDKPSFEWTHQDSTGTPIECEVRLVRLPAEDQILVRGSIIDISERKKTDRELKRSHERYELIGSATKDAIWDWDLQTNERWGNESFYQLYGLNRKTDSLNDLIPFARTHPEDVDKLKSALEKAFQQKAKSITEEYRFKMPDGSYRTFLDRAFIQYDEKGIATRLIGAMQDITERKKVEEALKKSNERFEMIARTTHDAIWEWNLETDELWANEMHQKLYGLTSKDPVPLVDDWKKRIHPDDREATSSVQDKTLASDKSAWISEYKFQTGEHGYIDIYDRTYVVRNEEGKAIHLMGSMMDITERKKTEEELRKLNERYFTLMNNLDGIVWEADAKTFEFSFVSKQAERLLGYPVGQWLTEPNFWASHIFEADREWAVKYCIECTAEKKSHEFEYRMVAADGRMIWLRDIVTVEVENDEPVRLRGIMVDITERKEAEEALKKSEEQYRSLIEQASDPIMITDLQGNFLDVNSTLCELFGYKKEELLKLNIRKLIDGDQLKEQPMRFDMLAKGEHVFSQRRMVHKDGTIIEVEANVKMIPDGRVLAIARNITERKKAELAIRTSEETKRLIMNSALDAIVTMDTKGLVTGWNPQAEKIFGWSESEVVGKPLNEFIIPRRFREHHKKGLGHYMQTGNSSVLNRMVEITAMNREGKEFPVELSIVPIKQGDALFFCGFIRDITDRKKAEEKLQKEKELSDRIIETLPGVFYMIDANGNYIRWNKLKETISGYTHDEMKNMNALDFFEGEDKKNIAEAIQEGFKKGTVEVEANMLIKNREKLLHYFNGVVIDYEGKPCLMGMGIDITERKKAEEQVLKEKKLSESIINSLPGVFYLYNENGKLLRWNKNLEAVSGYSAEELRKLHALDFIDETQREMVKQKIDEVFEKGATEVEAFAITKDNERVPYYFNGWRVIFEGKPCLIGVGIDISERKKAEEEILLANERFNLIAKATNDFVWDADIRGNSVWRNENYMSQLGWKQQRDQEPEDVWENHIHPDDKKRVLAYLKKIVEKTKDSIWSDEYRFRKGDGSFITVYDRGYIMRDDKGKAYRVIGAMTDISAIKEAEELLKRSYDDVRRLASHLEKVREQERIHIAREIHDELGQQLTVLKMDIAWLNKKIEKKEGEVKERINDLLSVVDNTVKTVRRISSELRPSILDDLGIFAALEWQCHEFEKRTNIKTSFTSDAEYLKLPSDIATGLFRIFQESLTNIARHANATTMNAQLLHEKEKIVLSIKDDGKGFLITGIENKKTLGILGMRERVSLMGGEFNITSTPGKGTEIRVSVPVSNGS